jgi:hypothetical protein
LHAGRVALLALAWLGLFTLRAESICETVIYPDLIGRDLVTPQDCEFEDSAARETEIQCVRSEGFLDCFDVDRCDVIVFEPNNSLTLRWLK